MKWPTLLAALWILPATVNIAAEFDAATATNQVGLDLYRRLAVQQPKGNLILSPYSIESALALAYIGAEAETRKEMSRVLHFAADDAPVEKGFAALRTALDQISGQSRKNAENARRNGGSSDVIEWHAANRLFGQRGYDFRPAFVARMKDEFAAPFEPLDFRTAAEPSRHTINSWVEEQTRKKIRDLIPMGGISADTRLVLVNALYLKAPWETPFVKRATRPQPFHLIGGDTPNVATMQSMKYRLYAAENGFTVVTLAYVGGGLSFLIILPARDQSVEAVAAKLTPAHFARWGKQGGSSNPGADLVMVDLYLPKFRVQGSTLPLSPSLRALGMKRAFDEPRGSADFSRIAPRKPNDYLLISEVYHQTFLALDEEGTEAAAATAVAMMVGSSMPPPPVEVRVDRPFLFAIQHRASGACLFLGRINDPR